MDVGASIGKWRVLALTSLGHLINDGWSALIPVVADIAHEKQTPIFVVTLMSIAFYSAAALSSFHVGRWADRRGSRGGLVALGLAIVSGSFLGFLVVLNFTGQNTLYASIIALSVLAGFGTAFYHPISATIIMTAFPYSESGRAMGISGACGAVGSSTFPLIFVFLAIFIAQPGALVLMSALGLLAALQVAVGLRRHRGVAEMARESLRGKGNALTKDVLVLTAVTAARSVSTAGFTFWLATYLTTVRGDQHRAVTGAHSSRALGWLDSGTVRIRCPPGQVRQQVCAGFGVGRISPVSDWLYLHAGLFWPPS